MSQHTPPPDPLYSQVQQAEEGVDAAREAAEQQERVAREIGRIAVQGTSQPR